MSPTSPPKAQNDTGQAPTRNAKDKAASEGRALKAKAQSGAENAKAQAAQRGEDAKDQAADEISRTSSALRTAAGDFDDGSMQHRMFTQAADAAAGVSDALSDRSFGEIFEDLSRFGRRNPAALIGGAVLAGLLVSRFVKASQEDDPSDDTGAGRSSDQYRSSSVDGSSLDGSASGTSPALAEPSTL